jgi:Beta-lactamase
VAVQNSHPGAMLARLFQMQPLFEPGSRYAYSNSGYSALACIIQLLTQEPCRWHPYGFAWAIRELPGGKVVFHNGGGDGFNNAFYRFLDARLTVIVLTNLNPSRERGSRADALAREIARLYNPALVFPERHHAPLNRFERGAPPPGG